LFLNSSITNTPLFDRRYTIGAFEFGLKDEWRTDMQFDPDNTIVKLCAQGMEMEGLGKPEEAKQLFLQAWNEASNDFEKFTAAHYVARHQPTVENKLKWDKISLNSALIINQDSMKVCYPSLYLNIGKCYEDLQDFDNAEKSYRLALSYADYLQNDGYGNFLKSGIEDGIERMCQRT
jgi:rifampin ADP-ribosylating transferase